MKYELEKIVVGTFFLNPELLDSVKVDSSWLTGGYDHYFSWIEEQFQKAPGEKLRMSLCPYDPENIDQSLSFADPFRIDEVAEKLRDRFLTKRYRDILTEGISGLKHGQPEKWINKHRVDIENLMNNTEEVDNPHASMQIEDTLEIIARRMEVVNSGKELVGIKTGYRELDAYLGGWEKRENVILAGRPGMGKTTCALNFAIAAARSGEAVDIYSLEMDKHKLLVKLGSQISGVDLVEIYKGRISQSEFVEFTRAMDEVRDLPIFMHDKLSRWEQIRSAARKQKAKFDTGLIVIDYLQLIEGSGNKFNREQEISKYSRGIKNIGSELDCATITLSQLSRAVEGRADKRPRLSDLRESGSIEQDADIVIFPFRPIYYYNMDGSLEGENGGPPHNGVEFDVQKFRMGEPRLIKPDVMTDINSITPRRAVPEGDNFW